MSTMFGQLHESVKKVNEAVEGSARLQQVSAIVKDMADIADFSNIGGTDVFGEEVTVESKLASLKKALEALQAAVSLDDGNYEAAEQDMHEPVGITLFRVVAKDDAINNEETLGPEVKVLHLTREGAEAAKEDVDANWDEDWGDQPETEIAEVSFGSRAEAKGAGYIVRK